MTRIASLGPVGAIGIEALHRASQLARTIPSRREILPEGAPITEPLILFSGWAYQARTLRDGRRQILGLALPGDLLGYRSHGRAAVSAPLIALTNVALFPAPRAGSGDSDPGLAAAYAASAALQEHYLLLQIARLGRMSAMERIADWLLELRERLKPPLAPAPDSFPLPVTQEFIADALGLTSVHVNRTLQTMRRDGLIDFRHGLVMLHDIGRLEHLADFRPALVNG